MTANESTRKKSKDTQAQHPIAVVSTLNTEKHLSLGESSTVELISIHAEIDDSQATSSFDQRDASFLGGIHHLNEITDKLAIDVDKLSMATMENNETNVRRQFLLFLSNKI